MNETAGPATLSASGPGSPDPGPRSERVVIAYLAFLGMLLATGIDISLPAYDEIDADLGANDREALIISLYFLGAAFGQLVVGPVSDSIGRTRTLLGGLAIYVVAAAVCALAPNFGVLLGARFVWGLGAAAPTGMRTAITRDMYSGDHMARITTIIMAVFLLGPIITPLIGEALLQVSSWRAIYWFTVGLAAIAVAATLWFGETLPPERRRPLRLDKFGQALRAIVSTRVTLGHILANMFWSGAFLIFLGSSARVFDHVYGRAGQFAVLFAVIGIVTVPLLLSNNRVIARIGARQASLRSAAVAVTAAVVGAVVVLAIEETPSFWLWYGWLIVVSSFITMSTPSQYALALEPMGDLAGTASSLLFFSGFAAGSLLAWLVDVQLSGSVTPFVIGYAIYCVAGFAIQLWARPASAGFP